MRTETYPGTALYHSLSPRQATVKYLTNGGFAEVGRKSSRTFAELLPQALGTLGISLLLFIASGLIRFADPRLNPLRRLLFLVIPVHMAALSFFVSAEDCASVLLLYSPIVATLGVGFLGTVIQARRLPRIHSSSARLFWGLACCLPGLATALALRPAPSAVRLYSFAGASTGYLERLQTSTDGVLAASEPFTMAHYANVPVAYLPTSSVDFEALEARLNKQIVAFGVTPALRWDRPEDDVLAPWAETYRRVISLFSITELLPPAERDLLRKRISYPESLLNSIRTFQVTPVREPRSSGDYSAIFWDLKYVQSQPG